MESYKRIKVDTELKSKLTDDVIRIEKNISETIKNNIELIIKECIKDIDIDTLNYVTEKYHNKIMYELHDKIWR